MTFTASAVLVTAFLGDALAGVEILYKGQRNGNTAHNDHAQQIALAAVAAGQTADGCQNRGEQNGDYAGTHILGDLPGHRIAFALLEIAGRKGGAQLIGHIPHGIADRVEKVVGDNNPDSLRLYITERDAEHHQQADDDNGQG